jgi:hypothetical protein
MAADSAATAKMGPDPVKRARRIALAKQPAFLKSRRSVPALIVRMKKAAKEANVAEPVFELSGFFKVTFKRADSEIFIGRQSAVNRPSIGRYRMRRPIKNERLLPSLKNTVERKRVIL